MSNMWRFMATDPMDFRQIPPPTRVSNCKIILLEKLENNLMIFFFT